jgi:hypothetical protein
MLGRFRLRDLAIEIGMGENSETRASLSNMEVEKMAEEVLRRLLQLDASNGGQPAMIPVGVQLVEPVAQKPKRSPSNAATRAAESAGISPAVVGQASIATVAMEDVLETVKSLAAEITGNTQQLRALSTVLSAIQQTQAQVLTNAQSTAFQTQLNTALSLLFAEQVLQGTRPHILATALDDISLILAELGKARQGKK